MDKVDKLKKIWDDIPHTASLAIDTSETELINKYLDLFHFGSYFFVLFNTKTALMEYIDPNIEKVLGYGVDAFDLSTVLNNVHPDDLPYYYHYEKSAVRFFSGLSPELFFKYKFSYDFRLKTQDGSYKRVLQQVIPIHYFSDGGAKTIAIFTDLTHLNIGGIPKLSFIGMQGAASYYNVHLNKDFYLTTHQFSKKEFEILQYIVQGKKSEDIAKLLHRSIFTIQNHRKNILKKSGCATTQELLVKAIREGWV